MGGSEALASLRLMLRKGSERAQIAAAQILYRGRLEARSTSHEPLPSREERTAIEFPHLADKEDRACLTARPLRALKAGRKRPDAPAGGAAGEEMVDKIAKNGQVPGDNGSQPAASEAR
jgi:hypothetical protein